ncbi:5-carboxymethyl-2-hydroxymuconate isomerase [Salmonella enterica subsp. enterica serovar Choleraesuis]|nr:5-carboxymethyl-2-hydroxymuconate isomerase [Salmonella enterica subsp. enterica serovar Choleraesuis]
MPHFIVECSENIREQARLPALFHEVNCYLAGSGIFPLGGIRSRAHWVDTWLMADGSEDFAFVHMTLRIGHGREQSELEPVMSGLFALIKTHFSQLMEQRYLALSFTVDELHPVLNYKQNNVHALFKGR